MTNATISRRSFVAASVSSALLLSQRRSWAAKRGIYDGAIVIDGPGGPGSSASQPSGFSEAELNDVRNSGVTCLHLTLMPVGSTPPDRAFTRMVRDIALYERVIEAFRALVPTPGHAKEWDFSGLAEMWRASVEGFEDLFALGKEFELYVLRNPSARERAAAHRRKNRELVTAFIEEVAGQSGMTLRLPAPTLASIVLAAADGLTYAARIDGEDLFGPFLELLNAGMLTD